MVFIEDNRPHRHKINCLISTRNHWRHEIIVILIFLSGIYTYCAIMSKIIFLSFKTLSACTNNKIYQL